MSKNQKERPLKPCCSPARGQIAPTSSLQSTGVLADHSTSIKCDRPFQERTSRRATAFDPFNMALIPGGFYEIGYEGSQAHIADGEGPVRQIEINAFLMDRFCVTNQDFAVFVAATGYKTEAECFGWSFVFHTDVRPSARRDVLPARLPGAPWWRAVRGAFWRRPQGRGSHITGRERHPVVHVSWNDAQAYAVWKGKRLPTESEWEVAARGGLNGAIYPWGDELMPNGHHRSNTWQGIFPDADVAEDGYAGTAPVDAFAPNGYGLFNMTGNVWEWCSDFWSANWHIVATDATRKSPQGPNEGSDRVIRGGSYLCHASYCNRYRVAARTRTGPDSSLCHLGFRCAADIDNSYEL
ncbi:MAG: formylglycine-generating enzyme family protein [Acetobacter sp.]|nr:formylglycine-generating enzyme family protein [Acetobacter sp.]